MNVLMYAMFVIGFIWKNSNRREIVMEAFAIIPFLIMFIVYFGVLGLVIWFAVTLIKAQKERNIILKEISNKLGDLTIYKKE